MGWMVGVRFPIRAEMGFFSRHRVHTGSRSRSASYPRGTDGSFPGGKADHSPPF